MGKILKYGFSAVALVLAVLVYRGWASDIALETLVQKYATGASDFIDLPSGARAHFRAQGDPEGPTLVLLHGSNSSLHTWEPWVAALEADHYLITVDLPGHGLTGPTPADDYTYDGMVAFVDEFLDALHIKQVYLGGNSMGGGITLAYALAHSARLNGIILVDAAGIDVPENTKVKVDRPMAFNLAGHWYTDWILENVTPRSIVAEGLKKGFTDQSVITEAMTDRYWELARYPGNRRATGERFAWYQSGKAVLDVSGIILPTLILWGDDDKLIPVETGEELHRRIKGSTLIRYEGVGHVPMEEIPSRSAEAVRDFLSTLSGKD